jgi:protein-L-isoaspartate(D-aspartate) O-methyltransferase
METNRTNAFLLIKMAEDGFLHARQQMVELQLKSRNIRESQVLTAMGKVPRHKFLSNSQAKDAYADCPLPIEEGQTISQPYIVALMIQEAQLKPDDRVLEIGTGSGYAAAVTSECAAEVYSIERHPKLTHLAIDRLQGLGYSSVSVRSGDGSIGWPEKAPFDAIIVTCAAPDLPPSLVGQLADGGRLIIPVGDISSQKLLRITCGKAGLKEEVLELVRFVPLVGEEGF